MKKKIVFGILAITLVYLTACGSALEDDYPDKLYNTSKSGDTIYVIRYGSKIFETENYNKLDYSFNPQLIEGAFYKVVADIEYLSGGVAGYCRYPEIKNVHSCEEVSIDELSLPKTGEEEYGLIDIRDYADADYLINYDGCYGVGQNGRLLYKYDNRRENEDGSYSFYNGEITQEEIDKGVESGTVCCIDYFYMPAVSK